MLSTGSLTPVSAQGPTKAFTRLPAVFPSRSITNISSLHLSTRNYKIEPNAIWPLGSSCEPTKMDLSTPNRTPAQRPPSPPKIAPPSLTPLPPSCPFSRHTGRTRTTMHSGRHRSPLLPPQKPHHAQAYQQGEGEEADEQGYQS